MEKLTAEKGELLERHHDQVESLEVSLKEQQETVSYVLRIQIIGIAVCGSGIVVLRDITCECNHFWGVGLSAARSLKTVISYFAGAWILMVALL